MERRLRALTVVLTIVAITVVAAVSTRSPASAEPGDHCVIVRAHEVFLDRAPTEAALD